MASVNVLRVTFAANDPVYGVFVAGDVINTYFDTVTLQFSVTKNGVSYPQAGSSSIQVDDWGPFFDQSYRTVSLLVPNVCVGTDLYTFSTARPTNGIIFAGYQNEWPYALIYSIEPGANTCAVTPVIPDLAWSGFPVLINATSAAQPDGVFSYTATSSYTPIYYDLSNFYLSTGQTSSQFNNLSPGQWTVTARDAKGFTIRYTFQIQDMSLNLPPPPPLVVCDINFPGTPTISQDTGSGNGSITFDAVSSNTVQYALRDFIYGDGSGQSSSSFSNLVAGNYTLYAIDSKNCKAQYTFTIPLSTAPSTPPATPPTQGIKYQLKVSDYNEAVHLVNITKKSYTGAITQIDGGTDDPIIYSPRLEGEQDIFPQVIPAQLQLAIKSETPFMFQELFTNDSDTFRVQYYLNSSLVFVGKIWPQGYSEPYTEYNNYPVSLMATDGLAELDDLDFVDDLGNRFYGSQRSIAIIAYALRKLNFSLNIRCVANIYATGMNTAATDDPLDQAYVNTDAYYQNDSALSCLEVIKRILAPYSATIVQSVGYWWIIRREELIASPDYREFNPNGQYVSNGNYNPRIDIKQSAMSNRLSWGGASMDMALPIGNLEVNYDQGLRDTLIPNGEFSITNRVGIDGVTRKGVDLSAFTPVANSDPYFITGFSMVDEKNVALTMTGTGLCYYTTQIPNFSIYSADSIKVGLKYKIQDSLVGFRYQKVKLRVQHGSYYLLSDGTWTTTASDCVIYAKNAGSFTSWEITAAPSGVTTATLTVRLYSSYVMDAEFSSSASLKAKTTVGIPKGSRTEWVNGSDIYYYEFEANTSAESIPDIVRPNDYNAGTNPNQWILKPKNTNYAANSYGVTQYDQLTLRYLPGGSEIPAESVEVLSPKSNKSKVTKKLFHGSYTNLLKSIYTSVINLGSSISDKTEGYAIDQNYKITSRNFLRKSDGTPWDKWERDAVAESEKLQTIYLKSYAAQYRYPLRRITGQLSNIPTPTNGPVVYLWPHLILKENYDGTFYLPQGYSYHARQCFYEGEFIQLYDITLGGTSTAGGTSSFSSAFNSSFGS